MSDEKCPFCGSPIEENELLCSQCKENAKQRESINLSHEEDIVKSSIIDISNTVENNNNIRRNKRFSKMFIYFALGITLFVAAAVFSFLQYKKNREAQNVELTFWFSCIEKNTPQAYSEYLRAYPVGKFNGDAQMKIADLRQTELNSWEGLKKSSDLYDYYSFMSKYPDTPFKNDIKQIMDSLSWLIAQKEDSPESYWSYLENYKLGSISGYYSNIAQERYDYLRSIKRVEGDSLEKIKKIVALYFESLSKQDYSKLSDLFVPIIGNFYGEKNHASSVIIKTIQSDMQKNSVKSIKYIPDLTSFWVQQDSTGLYFTDLKVQKNIFYKSKKTDMIDELLRIELNPQLNVKSMYVKQ